MALQTLAPTGKRISLLEHGDFLPREPQNWDSRSVWVDLRLRVADHIAGRLGVTGQQQARPGPAAAHA